MKTLFIIIGLVIMINNEHAHSYNEDPKYKVSSTVDKASPTGVYVPENLDGCFRELKKILSPELIKEIEVGIENDMIKYHRGLGMWIRNNWGLWGESRLKKYFNDLGVHHPDDMSGIILTSFWRHLNNKPIKLKEQIKYYQDYWKKIKN